MSASKASASLLISYLFLFTSTTAFDPCPLLGPTFPVPTALSSSPIVKNGTDSLKSTFDDAVRTGNSSNGPFNNKTSSFSVGLFSIDPASTKTASDNPFLWEYHYTAPCLANRSTGVNKVDADSIYRIGSLTHVFNVWTLLANKGEKYLDLPITEFVPELAEATTRCSAAQSPLTCVDWSEVTLRELGSHTSGISRNYGVGDLAGQSLPIANVDNSTTPECGIKSPCDRTEFIQGITKRGPVFAPGTTPTYSDAAFQLLAYALEKISGKSFADNLKDSIVSPLGLKSWSLSKPQSDSQGVLPDSALWSAELGDGASSLGLYSNLRDLAKAGRAIISSSVLTPAQTRRWFKPVTLTSNGVNTNGMPWEIYSASNDPIIDTYTYLGYIGGYSSYIGFVPRYNVGFAVLAADSTGVATDLNPHVDFIAGAILPVLEQTAAAEALKSHAGSYVDSQSGAKLSIAPTYSKTGLNVLSFTGNNGTDFKDVIAKASGFVGGGQSLSFRLFPTNLETNSSRAFRAVYQDMDAFEDAGTPTCVSWMDVDKLVYKGRSLDSFIFTYKDGQAIGLEVPGFGLKLTRQGL